MNNDSVGNVMQKDRDHAIRSLVTVFGCVVYVSGIIYAEVHGYSLLSRGVDPQFLLWATIGIVALGITAVFLPLGLHYSFHASMQRFAAYAFYACDLGLLVFNAIVDYSTRTGEVLPGWLSGYMMFIMPATPIFAALGWSMLALLDPAQQERSTIEQLKASTRNVLRSRIVQQALSDNIDKQVDQAAEQMAKDIIEETLGRSLEKTRRRTRKDPVQIQEVPKLPVTNIPLNGKVYNEDLPAMPENPTVQRRPPG